MSFSFQVLLLLIVHEELSALCPLGSWQALLARCSLYAISSKRRQRRGQTEVKSMRNIRCELERNCVGQEVVVQNIGAARGRGVVCSGWLWWVKKMRIEEGARAIDVKLARRTGSN